MEWKKEENRLYPTTEPTADIIHVQEECGRSEKAGRLRSVL